MSFLLLLIVSFLTCIGQVCQKQAVVSWQSDSLTKARKNDFLAFYCHYNAWLWDVILVTIITNPSS